MFYKALLFNVFSIIPRVNKVSVKYKTKNIKTDVRDVFLEIKNHIRASIISSRNLRLTAVSVCMVQESGSRVRPLKKIVRVMTAITEKSNERIIISSIKRSAGSIDLIRKQILRTRILNTIKRKR